MRSKTRKPRTTGLNRIPMPMVDPFSGQPDAANPGLPFFYKILIVVVAVSVMEWNEMRSAGQSRGKNREGPDRDSIVCMAERDDYRDVGGTNTWTCEVEFCPEQEPRATQDLNMEVLMSRSPGMGESDSIAEAALGHPYPSRHLFIHGLQDSHNLIDIEGSNPNSLTTNTERGH